MLELVGKTQKFRDTLCTALNEISRFLPRNFFSRKIYNPFDSEILFYNFNFSKNFNKILTVENNDIYILVLSSHRTIPPLILRIAVRHLYIAIVFFFFKMTRIFLFRKTTRSAIKRQGKQVISQYAFKTINY